MLKLTYDQLVPFFQKHGLDSQIQSETNQIYAPLKVGEREFPFFVRIFEGSGLLQLLVFLPCNVPAERVSDMGRLLHMFNKELDVPGFGMDEMIGVVFFRCMVPVYEEEIPEAILESFLATFKTICQSFSPAVEALAAGAVTFDEMLAKANAAQKEAEEKQKRV
ncbi:MAG: YbjN domain-containing protein [Chlamydiales bacterium]|nr:YbjN domain-containing protein [Chlamydiales bacterium]